MALAEVQAALAKLFTQTQVRAAFARDPLAAGRALGLNGADAATLAEIAPRALDRFAAGLTAKRRLDAQKYVPLTSIALDAAFAARLREVLVEPPPGAAEDALALVRSLARDPRDTPPWIGDLASYEAAFVWARGTSYGLRVRLFHYPTADIAAALRAGPRIDPARALTLGLWARAPGGRLWHRCWRLTRMKPSF